MGIRPLCGDQAMMPAQDRARCDQAMPPQHLRQPADEGGEDRAIRPVQARLRVSSAQHGNFVAQHQELDVLGRRRAAEQQQQVQQLEKDKVEQTQRHGARSSPTSRARRSPRSAARADFWNPASRGCGILLQTCNIRAGHSAYNRTLRRNFACKFICG
jgi:hypothetical protein